MPYSLSRIAALIVAVVVLPLLSACTVIVKADPNAYPIEEVAPLHLKPGIVVDVVNGYGAPVMTGFYQGFEHDRLDLQDFTASAVTILKRELARVGVRTEAGAPRTIVLRVMDPSTPQGNVMSVSTALTTLEVTLGDQKVYAIGEASTAWSIDEIFNESLTVAIQSLLNKTVLQDYLNAG